MGEQGKGLEVLIKETDGVMDLHRVTLPCL